jgi:GTP 3',8-cyclase
MSSTRPDGADLGEDCGADRAAGHDAYNCPVIPIGLPIRRRSQAPSTGPLIDGHGRVHTDLRISVTDRCNFRCIYCMPSEGMEWIPRSEILTFEEIARAASVMKGLGINTVRLTGGEPLVRAQLRVLLRMLDEVGFDDISLTTNGVGLTHLAGDLAASGLRRVNISCDSLRRERFIEMTRRDALDAVLEGMEAAESAGLLPVKVNCVMMAGINDDEILDFARFARETGRVVRFIEYMPLDADHAWERPQVVPGEAILETIDAVWPLEAIADRNEDPAPADRYRFSDGSGEIGVITSVTQAFCGTCNRLRLTADGAVRNCLFAPQEWSLRDAMRAGATDEQLGDLVRQAVWHKLPGHAINDPSFLRPARSMSMIGG